MAKRRPAVEAEPTRRSTRPRLSAEQAAAARAAARAAREAATRRAALEDLFDLRRATVLRFDAAGELRPPEGAAAAGAWPRGLFGFRLDDADFAALAAAHADVKASAPRGMGWAGGSDPSDPRWRAFGLPPGARARLRRALAGFHSFETPRADRAREAAANWNACVDMTSFSPPLAAALDRVAARVRAGVDARYRPHAAVAELAALQPNVQNGADCLPAHLDWPRHDGFGVVIATLAVKRAGCVVLRDAAARAWRFELPERHVYVLSGDARNACTHGVVCAPGVDDRESLNLRFGLHTQQLAKDEIYAGCAREPDPACGPDGPE